MRSCVLLVLFLASATPLTAQFSGSGHDFTDGVTHNTRPHWVVQPGEDQWNLASDKCSVCHSAHTPSLANPLWIHRMTSTHFTTYGDGTLPSKTLDATVGQPNGTSLLCLSCHDGSVGVDQYGWSSFVGPDDNSYTVPYPHNGQQHRVHPISFVYDQTLAAIDGFLADPISETLTLTAFNGHQLSGTIDKVLLDERHEMQCNSCHDVHNKFAQDSSLVLTYSRSQLCKKCHKK